MVYLPTYNLVLFVTLIHRLEQVAQYADGLWLLQQYTIIAWLVTGHCLSITSLPTSPPFPSLRRFTSHNRFLLRESEQGTVRRNAKSRAEASAMRHREVQCQLKRPLSRSFRFFFIPEHSLHPPIMKHVHHFF